MEQLNFYRSLLVHLGNECSGRVQVIFANSSTTLRQPKNLNKLVQNIDELCYLPKCWPFEMLKRVEKFPQREE